MEEIGLLEGIATTRAIRRIRTDPIPDEDLAKIMFAATRAPTGSNRQTFRFLVLRDGPKSREAKTLLGRGFRAGWNVKREQDDYDAAEGRPLTRRERMARAMQQFVDNFERVPVVVLPCFVRYRQPTPTEGGSIYPAVQNMLLAARALGYGGVITMWHALVERELRELLKIPEGVLIAATIPLGRPVGRHGPVRRRPIADLVFEDGWDEPAAWAKDPPGTRFTRAGPRSP